MVLRPRRVIIRYRADMVTASSTDTEAAARLRNAMADAWGEYGLSFSGMVEQAMRAVPRHLFLPEFALDVAYGERSVVTHSEADGTALSSASAPSTVAEMLDQLEVRPGHRILEIGAGTGYNAALLAHLAGSAGHVTTIDIIPEVAESAAGHLAAAGYDNVDVICGDGAFGHARNAPYDRIIVTAGAFDIPPDWTRQADPGARMVIPLRVSGYSLRVALELDEHADGRTWRSPGCELDGFIPMRGAGYHPERDVAVTGTGKAELRIDGHLHVDASAIQEGTRRAPAELWTGKTITGWNRTSLAIWLLQLGGTGWLFARQPGHGLAALDDASVRLAILDVASGDTFAYLSYRPAAFGHHGDAGDELGVCAYGPHARQLTARVADRIRAWADEHPRLTTSVEVYPAGITIASMDGVIFHTAKEHIQVVLRNKPADG
jgi:protein-L-isoaspartate(D-aspartate) O-methyltransferase